LVEVVGRQVVVHLGRATRKRQVVAAQVAFAEQLLLPVGVGEAGRAVEVGLQVVEAQLAQAGTLGQPGGPVVADAAGGRVGRHVAIVAGLGEEERRLGRIHVLYPVGALLPAGVHIERHAHFVGFALLGGDNDHAVGCPRAVYGGRGGVFQDVQLLDILRIYRVQGRAFAQRKAIDHDERVAPRRERADAPNHDLRVGAGLGRGVVHDHAGRLARQLLPKAAAAVAVQLGALHLRNHARHLGLRLRAVANHDHIGEGLVLGLQPHHEAVVVAGVDEEVVDALRFIAHVAHREGVARASLQVVEGEKALRSSGDAARVASGTRLGQQNRDAGQRLALVVEHGAFHAGRGLGRRAGARLGRSRLDQQQAAGHEAHRPTLQKS